ncbi:winged helix-turn-helix domain-containing protein [Erythrobacter crassostreae]|uniref:winged helix-turn-helix domain-containing protein n=1 Tax=Erythrobacter crassostreae TaxID=2828328 RepID=UPI0021081386|nr:winged helix-turn-helix domain-containing protein [Erythrobacter crassostrea]
MNSNAAYTIFPDNETLIPRFREVGEITLDLIHRDGRVGAKWIGFHPREFELLWRLAEEPGLRMTKKQLLADVWRLDFEPESNSVAVHVARVRAKLSTFGLDGILLTHPDGGYLLNALPGPSVFSFGSRSTE